MKKNLIKILVMLAVFAGIILVTNQVQAGSIRLNSLNFQIQLNEDGSMDVIENWNARITDTNTMFKEITNIEVYRVDLGNRQKLTQMVRKCYMLLRIAIMVTN